MTAHQSHQGVPVKRDPLIVSARTSCADSCAEVSPGSDCGAGSIPSRARGDATPPVHRRASTASAFKPSGTSRRRPLFVSSSRTTPRERSTRSHVSPSASPCLRPVNRQNPTKSAGAALRLCRQQPIAASPRPHSAIAAGPAAPSPCGSSGRRPARALNDRCVRVPAPVTPRRKLSPAVREALRELGREGGKKGGPKGGKARWEGVSAEARRCPCSPRRRCTLVEEEAPVESRGRSAAVNIRSWPCRCSIEMSPLAAP